MLYVVWADCSLNFILLVKLCYFSYKDYSVTLEIVCISEMYDLD